MTEKRERTNRNGKSRHKHEWTNDKQPAQKRKYLTKFFSWLIWLWSLRKEIVAHFDKLSPATESTMYMYKCTLFGDSKWPFRMNNMKNWVSNQRITFEMKQFAFFSCVQFFFMDSLHLGPQTVNIPPKWNSFGKDNEHENEKYIKYSMRYKSCLKDGIRQDKVHVFGSFAFCTVKNVKRAKFSASHLKSDLLNSYMTKQWAHR